MVASASTSMEADAGGIIVAGKSICGQPSASATHRRSFAVAKTVHHAPWYLRREQTGHPLCRSDERTAGWTCQSLGLGRVPGRPSLHGQGVQDAYVLEGRIPGEGTDTHRRGSLSPGFE